MTTITINRATVEQALEVLEDWDSPVSLPAITALRTALAQEQAKPQGCDHCNHPLYAATKCRVCGRVTEQAEPVEPVAWCSSVEFSDALKYAQSFNGWRRKYPKTDMPLYTAPPQQAEPLEPHRWEGDHNIESPFNACMHKHYCMTLKQAEPAEPAEPVKPVAWVDERAISWLASRRNKASAHITTGLSAAKTIERTVPLYTAPPQRKPLTQEQLYALYDEHATHQEEGPAMSGWFDFARAIERAHGITGDPK